MTLSTSLSASSSELANPLNAAVINARSISAKTESLVDLIRNTDCHFVCVSETWLSDSNNLRDNVADLEASEAISMITKCRRRRGGGVAICFDQTKVNLKRFPCPSEFEIVCASGYSNCNKRPLFVVSYYIPPSTKAEQFGAIAKTIEDMISSAKIKLQDPMIFIAGDANNRPVGKFHEDFPDVNPIACPASRGPAALLQFSTNLPSPADTLLLDPLVDRDGVASDHKVVFFRFDLPKQDCFIKRKISYRTYTQDGAERFGSLLLSTDWRTIETGNSSSSCRIFSDILAAYTDQCFPLKTRTVKSNDLPWANRKFKRKKKQRNRCFKSEGRSVRWKSLKRETDKILLEEKVKFLERFKEKSVKDGSSKYFFHAVKALSTRNAPKQWKLMDMFPGKTEQEAVDTTADFFNKISREYTPIPRPPLDAASSFRKIEAYEISARLKSIKKPKGLLEGDIDPRLNNLYSDLLAAPLAYIYDLVSSTCEWPDIWKSERVTVIPKTSCPGSLNQLRNLSCTPVYSKLLESFILEELKKHVKLSEVQYGGLKGCGVNHFLVETWDQVLSNLEDHRAATNLVSIDFEKAFNRMDHGVCLEDLKAKGCPPGVCGMVAAFLHGRTMSVKYNGTNSMSLPVSGGSPQGSILGNYLFCVTVDSLSSNTAAPSLMLTPPRPARLRPIGFESTSTPARIDSDSDSDPDECVQFFRTRRPFTVESSDDDEPPAVMSQGEIDNILGVPPNWVEKEIQVKCYIDDFNNVEKIRIMNSVSHLTTNHTKTLVHAPKSQKLLSDVRSEADRKKMRVNGSKTQMLCITDVKEVRSYIVVDGSRLVSGDQLKILGFTFGKKPNVTEHVNAMLIKLRRRLWILPILKQSGMSRPDLVAVYFALVRPVADFAAPVYHSLLSSTQSNAIEKIQLRAFKYIFGNNVSYRQVLESMNFKTMQQRREELFQDFAKKSSVNARFRDAWFPLNHEVDYAVRSRNMYQEFHCRTSRMYNSPLYSMRRYLNSVER